MTKLAVLRRQASVGTYVTLRLTRGEDVSGRIAELEDTHVCLDLGGRSITVFGDCLAGWEVHRGDRTAKEASGPPAASEDYGKQSAKEKAQPSASDGLDDKHQDPAEAKVVNQQHARGDSPARATDPSTPLDSATDRKVLARLARVEAAFSEAVKRARLEPPEPDFGFSEAAFPAEAVAEVRREWDRARNQYAYAVKVRELSRVSSVVIQVLDPLVKRYPDSAPARSLLGQVLLKLGRQSEAKEHLALAAALSDAPQHWLALASAAGEDAAVECYALRRYFVLTPPHRGKEAWFRYIAVANDHSDQRAVAQVIHDWSEHQEADGDLDQLLCESVIYLLSLSEAESLALQATNNLVYGTGELPEGWKDPFNRRAPASEELRDVERRFARPHVQRVTNAQRLRPKGGTDAPHGRVVSFGDHRFGFIDAPDEKTFFFGIDDVADARLRQALLDGSWRTFGDVEFVIRPPRGNKYARAARIAPLPDARELLERARRLLQSNQHAQALAFVRRALAIEPSAEAACRLETKIKQQIRKRGIGLPRGKGPYARAKRAQLVDQDLDAAEHWFLKAIRQPDNRESAVKDLASVLQQQGRADAAIALMEENSKHMKDRIPYNNTLATLYQHAGRYDDAVRVLKLLLRKSSRSQRRPLLTRIAFSHIGRGRYDDAESALREILKRNPDDRTAERMLASLEDVREAGSPKEAEEIIGELGGLTEDGVELSSLARSAIENCTFEGVNPARVQAGTVGSTDVGHVAELAKKLGTNRPRDRAAYYLSAAALLERDPGDGRSARIYDYLRRYFASIADASWIEKKPADVVRSFYVESLALVFADKPNEAWRSLLQYLATFSREAALPTGRQVPREGYENALQAALGVIAPDVGAAWLEGLLVLGSQSRFARERIGDAIVSSATLVGTFSNLLKRSGQQEGNVKRTWESRCRDHARTYRQRLSMCRTFTKYEASAASMEDLDAQLEQAREGTGLEMDRRRLNALRDIVEAALGFCRASDFEERERNYWLVTTRADRFDKEVSDAPTQYSHEGLLPVSDHLRSLIEAEFAQMARTSGAELSLRLLVEQYVRDQKGELKLQIEVSNKRGCSPASSVRICLGPGDSEYFAADRREREIVSTLRGGDTVVTHMVVHPKANALGERAFPIEATAVFSTRLGEERRTADYPWTVRLYRDEEFQRIDNPYAPFAEGGPVDDAAMFVGRDDLLSRLESSLLAGSGSKSVVMFGQKRAGKSSLLEHLRRRLGQREGIVPICLGAAPLERVDTAMMSIT